MKAIIIFTCVLIAMISYLVTIIIDKTNKKITINDRETYKLLDSLIDENDKKIIELNLHIDSLLSAYKSEQ